MPRAIVLWAILLLGTIAFANGLKCYAGCSGPGECEEGVPTTDTPVDCSDQLEDQGVDAASCVKVTTRIEGQLQMAKTCAPEKYCEMTQLGVELAKAFDDGSDPEATEALNNLECKECTTDYCNNATGLRAGVWTALLASVVTFVTLRT
jgi:hypothetical protein